MMLDIRVGVLDDQLYLASGSWESRKWCILLKIRK